MNRVIITGGNGFIGSHLVKKLLSFNACSVVLIANSFDMNDKRLSYGNLNDNTELLSYMADIRDRSALLKIFQNERPDACIHLAAKISVSDSIINPSETMDINAKGTLNVLEACYKTHVDNFIFASSAAVYGDPQGLPISENQRLAPLSPYGESKLLAEQHVQSYKSSGKIQNTISFRIFNAYGQGQSSQKDVITRFAQRLSKGLAPIIYGDGTRTRDFISVDDVANGILSSIRTLEQLQNRNQVLPSSVFNLGTGTPTSINDLSHKMIEISNLDLRPLYNEDAAGSREIMHSYADMTKSKEVLNFVAKKRIETGLREIMEPLLIPK